MKKRPICVILAAALAGSLLSGCGSAEAKPRVTLNIKTPVYQFDTVFDEEVTDSYSFLKKAAEDFAKQYEDADVTVQITQYEATRQGEEIEGCYDTDQAVDVWFGLYFNMSSYIHSGRVVPVDGLISDEIREDIGEDYWELSAAEGKTYMMPFVAAHNVFVYNKELFREAGLDAYISDADEIQNWTLEEWDYVLETLRANLPSSVYPMMMYAGDSNGDTHIMTLLRSRGSTLFDEDGKFRLDTEEGRAALQWIRDCNTKGYFPPNPETMVMLDNYDLFMNGQLAIYCGNVALSTLYDEAGMDYGLVNFPSMDGTGYYTAFVTGFEIFDNGDEAKLQAAEDFVKYIYESDWLDYCAGGIPVSRRVAEKYSGELSGIEKYLDNTAQSVSITENNPNWSGVRERFHLHIQDLLYGEKSIGEIAEEIDLDCNAAIDLGYKKSEIHE